MPSNPRRLPLVSGTATATVSARSFQLGLHLVQHLLDSGIVAEAPVDVIAKAGFALATARADAPREVGLWGAARAMSDDDVKRAVGFLIRVAQVFGRSLDEPAPARLAKGAAR